MASIDNSRNVGGLARQRSRHDDYEMQEGIRNLPQEPAKELKIHIIQEGSREQERDIKSIIKDVYKHFKDTKSLFIFDNAEEYKDINGFLPSSSSLSPNNKKPYTLITSRNQNWDVGKEGSIEVVKLDDFTPEEAAEFIKKTLDIKDESQKNEIQELAEILQRFPLALQQATTYIKEKAELKVKIGKKFEISDYLKEYKEEKKKTDLLDFKSKHGNDRYIETVFTTWKITLKNIEQKGDSGKRALEILNIMVYLDPDEIPTEKFFSELAGSEEKLLDAIALLEQYSMINVKGEMSNIHRLVQEVVRLELNGQGKEEEVLRKALELVKSANLAKEETSHVVFIWKYASKYDKLINDFYFDSIYGEDKNTPLHLFAASGEKQAIKDILISIEKNHSDKLGDVINTKNNDGSTPLHWAAQNGHLETVKYLIDEKKADVAVTTKAGSTPLHWAAQNGHLETVKYLIDEKKADVAVTTKAGWTPLYWAAQNGHLEIVKYLVDEKKADFNAQTKDGYTPLHMAARNGKKEVVDALLDSIKDNPEELKKLLFDTKEYGMTPLHYAALSDHTEVIDALLGIMKNNLNSLKELVFDQIDNVHEIDFNDRSSIVKSLLERAAESFIKNKHHTVLHEAVHGNKEEIIKLILNKIKETKESIEPYINAKDTEGDTPLMWAAENGKINAAQALLKYEMNVDVQNNNGETALHWAAKGGYQEIVQLLLNKQVDPNIKDKKGKTALDLAQEKLNQDPENDDLKIIESLLLSKIDKPVDGLNQQVQSNKKQQNSFIKLSKYVENNFPEVETKAVKQGLYLPSFESRNIKISGKCAAIIRMFSQGLFLEQSGSHELFLANLQTSAELYERMAQGKQISSREEKEIFDLSKLLDSFEQQLDSPTSSLPLSLSHIKSYKTLDDLSLYVGGLTDDFAIHLVTSNHVVAIYRAGDTYTYFDSNVAFVSSLKSVDQLMKVVKKGVAYAGYELAEEGFLVEYFDVAQANNALTTKQKEILTKPIQTERHLLSLQDQEHGPIDVDGEKISRVALYDMGAKLHVEGSAPILINSEMSSEDLAENLSSGKIKITAREYLQNLKGNEREVVQDLVQKVSTLSFDGSAGEIKDAQTIQDLVLSENGQRLNSYELNKILSGRVEQSIKALPYYLEVANTKHWPNRLTNAAGRISMAKGLYDVAHSIRYGDTEGFLLGSGEIGFSLFSQLIEDGVVKVAPQVIKQMKHGIFLTRGFAGLISSPFDIYDLVSSSIDLANAEKGSKEWRDSIAGVAFSGTSVTTGVAFTALGKSGVGTVVGLGILIGQSFYSGTSMVIEYKKYKLTTNQEFRLFWHTFALQLPPEDVQYLAARQDVVNGLAEQAWEYLQNNDLTQKKWRGS